MLERTLGRRGLRRRRRPPTAARRWRRSSARVPDAIVLDVAMPGPGRAGGHAAAARRRACACRSCCSPPATRVHERVAGPRRRRRRLPGQAVRRRGADRARARAAAPQPRRRGEQLAFADLTLEPETRHRARAAAATSSSPAARPSCWSCCCATPRGVVTRELALEEVWGGEGEATPNAVDRYVAYLRRKLGDPPLIHTVRGVGFRLGPRVTRSLRARVARGRGGRDRARGRRCSAIAVPTLLERRAARRRSTTALRAARRRRRAAQRDRARTC